MLRLKIFLSIILFCSSTFSSYAQSKWGIELGGICTKLNTNPPSKMKIGTVIGGRYEYTTNCHLVVQTGLLYVIKGGNDIHTDLSASPEIKAIDVRLSFLEVPLMIGYKFYLKNSISLTPSIGPFVSYGICGYGEMTSINLEAEPPFRVYEDSWNPFKRGRWDNWSKSQVNAFNRWDAGVKAAVTVDVYRCSLKLAYEYGLTTIWHGFNSNKEIRNQAFSLSVGYWF